MNKYLILRWGERSWGKVLMAIVNDNAFAMSSIFFKLPYKNTFNVTLQNTLEQSFTINRNLYPNIGLLIVSSFKNWVNCCVINFVFKIESIELMIIQYDYRQLDKDSLFL